MKYLFDNVTAYCVPVSYRAKLRMQFKQVLFFIRRERDCGERKRKSSSVTCRLTSAERICAARVHVGVLIVLQTQRYSSHDMREK